MNHTTYIICTEDEMYGMTCKHKWQAELFAFWLGTMTWLRLHPQSIHLLTIGKFKSDELQRWADEYKSWTPAGRIRRDGTSSDPAEGS